MRVLLINDTSATTNPGCKAAVEGIARAYHARFGEVEARTLPVGYWSEPFVALACAPRDAVQREAGSFPSAVPRARGVNVGRWTAVRDRQARLDGELARVIGWSELVVVNGEGSIHHNLPRALALLALADVAADSGKSVHLVNSTLFAMDEELLAHALKGIAFVHVRELASARVLESLEIEHHATADLACLALSRAGSSAPLPAGVDPGRACLVTAGVLVQQEILHALVERARAAGLDPVYLSIGDGGETKLATETCARLGVPVVHASALPLGEIVDYLSQFTIAISGRHHVNLMLFAARVPFVPLPSNSCKIEETLRLVGYPMAPALDPGELATRLADLLERHESWAGIAGECHESALASARSIVERIPSPSAPR